MKILFIDIVHPVLEERLTKAGYTCIDGTKLSREECETIITNVSGVVVRSRLQMNASFLSHAKDLKFIARSGAGMENIDLAYCKKNNITLYNAPEGNRNAVGEHALGMLLSLFNRLHLADREVKDGKWEREGNRGIELDGKTVGIIGFGNNGAAFAKKLRGFDVQILAYDKYKSGFGNEFVKESTLEELYQNCDVVSFHIPQNEETIYFANDEFFTSFIKNIYLINLSRGKVVKTSSLVDSLKNGKILGACLDVLEYEKSSFESFFDGKEEIHPDFDYLLNSEKVMLSPHVGGWTVESYFKLSNVLADKILK
ncbi:MAG: phosphoglycerate dehydrogenase [Fluviicola sp.]|nr:phosphoglycerate dehydrogenase [Fluviicola sp.]